MKCRIKVTFEFELVPPVTAEVEVEGGSLPAIIRRAVTQAQKQLSTRGWSSVVVVVLEREMTAPGPRRRAPQRVEGAL